MTSWCPAPRAPRRSSSRRRPVVAPAGCPADVHIVALPALAGSPPIRARGFAVGLASCAADVADQAGTRRHEAPQTLYLPGKPDVTRSIHATETELMKIGRIDPTNGFFSNTFAHKGASSSDDLYNAVKDIVAGRKPPSSCKKEVLPKWRRDAGDAMRREYEKAVAASK
ncbi:hypothetical protein ACWD0A_15260 [Streptomyces sp. NPDC002867]